MRILFDIYESKDFAPDSKIGNITLYSVPTSVPYPYGSDIRLYLTNFLEIKTEKPEKNGEYFVYRSVIYMDKQPKYPTIELYIEKDNVNTSTFLYLKGGMPSLANETFIKIKLIGDIETETKSLVLPRTTFDYIYINELYYQHNKLIYNQDGSVTIDVSNGISLTEFRNSFH